jgi:hypothetical protein
MDLKDEIIAGQQELLDHHRAWLHGREEGMRARGNGEPETNAGEGDTPAVRGWLRGWGEMDHHLRMQQAEQGLGALLKALREPDPAAALLRVQVMREALETIEHNDGWTLSPPSAELLAKALKGGA